MNDNDPAPIPVPTWARYVARLCVAIVFIGIVILLGAASHAATLLFNLGWHLLDG